MRPRPPRPHMVTLLVAGGPIDGGHGRVAHRADAGIARRSAQLMGQMGYGADRRRTMEDSLRSHASQLACRQRARARSVNAENARAAWSVQREG